MSLNILEIWDAVGQQTLFAVKPDHWNEGEYVVVEKIEIEKWPYRKAYGYPIVGGKHSDRFEYHNELRINKIIPSIGTYKWWVAANVGLNEGKTIAIKKKKSKVLLIPYTRHSISENIKKKL